MTSAYWAQWHDDIESMHGMDFPYEDLDELHPTDYMDDETEEEDDSEDS